MPKRKEYIRDGRAPIPVKESTSEIMSSIKDRNTKPELILRKALWSSGIKGYRLHWKKAPGRPDIAFPGKKVAVFVNGCFWHRCPHCNPPMPKSHSDFWKNKFEKNVERDKRKIDQLKNIGWETLIIWECRIKNELDTQIDEIQGKLL
jgi:DNA mismatch endonuclease (patch repair protein)